MSCRFSASGSHHLVLGEYDLTILNDELHSSVLCVHICHLSLNSLVSHDGGRKDYCQIFRRHLNHVSNRDLMENGICQNLTHQIFLLSLRHSNKMEHQELKTVPMFLWQEIKCSSKMVALLNIVLDGCSIGSVMIQK